MFLQLIGMLVFTFRTSLLSFICQFFFLNRKDRILMNIKSVVLLSILKVILLFNQIFCFK